MRYLPHSDADRRSMLAEIGVKSVDDLFADVPSSVRLSELPDLAHHTSEMGVERIVSDMAKKNLSAEDAPFFVGGGAYHHHVPSSVDHIIQRSEFLTSYTPYQPEVSQGTLQYLYEFQSQVAMLTGMEIANASMYDGSTATAEAVLMAHRLTRREKAVVSGGLHPQYTEVLRTIAKYSETALNELAPGPQLAATIIDAIDDETSCVVVQNPDFFGGIHDLQDIADAAHAKGALMIVVVTEIISLGAMRSPGEMGADIVVGEGQSLGNGLNFGGPYVGLLATRKKFLRQMPGRVSGQTVDQNGQRGFVLTLSAREQHIRREKATSNICTNSGLCSLAFTIHLTLLGEKGLRKLARINHTRAVKLATRLAEIEGVDLVTDRYFNEFTISVPKDAGQVINKLADQGILAGLAVSRLLPDHAQFKNLIVLAVTETVSDGDMDRLCAGLEGVLS